MRHTTEVPATFAMPLHVQHEVLTSPPQVTAWWKRAALLHGLQAWVTAVTHRRASTP